MKKIIIFTVIALFLLGGIIIMNKSSDIKVEATTSNLEKKSSNEKEKKKENSNEVTKIKVDIKGSVANPNVYEVDSNSRVIDVINIAGGLTLDADTDSINLSKKVKDEDVIIIYSSEEINNSKNDYLAKIDYCNNSENDACISSVVTFAEERIDNASDSSIININTATVDDLMNLSGIGEAKAKAIVDYRDSNGSFKSIEDIKNVSGIGDSIFDKIKDYITI